MGTIYKGNIITIFLLIGLAVYCIFFPCKDSIAGVKGTGILSVIVLVYCVYYEIKRFGRINLFVIFTIMAYMVHCGQCLSITMGTPLDKSASYVYGKHGCKEIIYAARFSILSLTALSLGGSLAYGRKVKLAIGRKKDILGKELTNINSMLNTGMFLCAVSIPFDIYFNAVSAVRSMRYGYLFLYEGAYSFKNSSSILGTMSLFCIPGCFLLAYAWKVKGSRWKYLPVFYLVIRSISDFVTGGRGEASAVLIALVYFLFLMDRQKLSDIKMKYIIMGGIGAYLFSGVFLSIFVWRNADDRSIESLFSELIAVLLSGGVFRKIVTSLSVEYPLYEVIRGVKDGTFGMRYGLTFLYSIIMIIPSFLRGDLYKNGYEAGLIALEGDLTAAANVGYGIGYTLFTEAYLNLGMFGCLLMIPYGYVVGKIIIERRSREKNIDARIPLKIAIFTILILTLRSSMQLFYKYNFYYYVIPQIMIVLFRRKNI